MVGDTSSGRLFASPRESQPTVRIAKEGSAVIKELKAAFEFCADWSWGRKFHSGPRSLSPEELNERGSHRARGTGREEAARANVDVMALKANYPQLAMEHETA